MRMRRARAAIPGSCLAVPAPVASAVAAEGADHVFENGEVYTLAGARQMRMADQADSLEAGERAGLVVLEKDLFASPPSRPSTTKVQLIHDERVDHQRGAGAA